jgi:transposase InsO family protein
LKTGTAVSAAFGTVLNNHKYLKPIKQRPVWVQTDKGKEFLNASFQDLLKREGIEIHVCKNPDIKCAFIEHAHRTIRDNLYK